MIQQSSDEGTAPKVIRVIAENSSQVYEAHGWALDSAAEGVLHVTRDGNILATYAPGAWASVWYEEEDQ